MTLGEKIKRIRLFRGMTQKEFGIKVGYGESSADVRIAQYESGKRTPKRETLLAIAEILEVNPANFFRAEDRNGMELIQVLLWMEEEVGNEIILLPIPQSENGVGLFVKNAAINETLYEWMQKKALLGAGRITDRDYLEWKLGVECR